MTRSSTTLKNNGNPLSRRKLIKGAAVIAGAGAPMLNFGRFRLFAESNRTYSAKAIELVNRSLVIDMLSIMAPLGDTLSAFYAPEPNLKRADYLAFDEDHMRKLLNSGVDVFHPAVGISTREEAFFFVSRLNAYAAERPEHIRRIDAVEDMDAVRGEDRIGLIVGVQNANHFEELDDVNQFYNLGQRVSQLTYNAQNLLGAGATDRSGGGLSDYGAQVVERMNDVGMAVDVSHCNDRTTMDAFEVSKKPVLITHSNARSLAPGHPRCKPDEVIQKMARLGSVMGITGVRIFIRNDDPTTIEHMLDHYDHVARLVGVEHVGVGSDMDSDGYDDIPAFALKGLKSNFTASYGFREKIDTDGFDHPRRIYDLTEGLLRRGYGDADIELILGGNFRRVLGEIWKPQAI